MDLLLALTDGSSKSCRVGAAVPAQLHWNSQVPVRVKYLHMGRRYCPLLSVLLLAGIELICFLVAQNRAVFWVQCACHADNTLMF